MGSLTVNNFYGISDMTRVLSFNIEVSMSKLKDFSCQSCMFRTNLVGTKLGRFALLSSSKEDSMAAKRLASGVFLKLPAMLSMAGLGLALISSSLAFGQAAAKTGHGGAENAPPAVEGIPILPIGSPA